MHHYNYIYFVKLLRLMLFYICVPTFEVVDTNLIAFFSVVELICS